MLLYHGSPADFAWPSMTQSRGHRDFGNGLYLAEDEIDALTCCFKGNGHYGFLYTFETDEDEMLSRPDVIRFLRPDTDWLRMVYDCRMGRQPSCDAVAAVVGPTAGHKVNSLFRSYRRDATPFPECVEELRRGIVTDKFGMQWCLRTQGLINGLVLVDKERISRA